MQPNSDQVDTIHIKVLPSERVSNESKDTYKNQRGHQNPNLNVRCKKNFHLEGRSRESSILGVKLLKKRTMTKLKIKSKKNSYKRDTEKRPISKGFMSLQRKLNLKSEMSKQKLSRQFTKNEIVDKSGSIENSTKKRKLKNSPNLNKEEIKKHLNSRENSSSAVYYKRNHLKRNHTTNMLRKPDHLTFENNLELQHISKFFSVYSLVLVK